MSQTWLRLSSTVCDGRKTKGCLLLHNNVSFSTLTVRSTSVDYLLPHISPSHSIWASDFIRQNLLIIFWPLMVLLLIWSLNWDYDPGRDFVCKINVLLCPETVRPAVSSPKQTPSTATVISSPLTSYSHQFICSPTASLNKIADSCRNYLVKSEEDRHAYTKFWHPWMTEVNRYDLGAD